LNADKLNLSVQSTTGVPLNSEHAKRIELIYSSDLRAAAASWLKLEEPLTTVGQTLQVQIPLLPGQARFIRVREKP